MTFLDPALRERAQELAADILSCEYCRENEDGFVLGDPMEIQTLLGEAGVPEDDWEAYLRLIWCPNCGTSGTDFSLTDEVGLPTAEERLHRERWHEWAHDLGPRVTAFAAHLEAYPYLGGTHDVGKEILATLPAFPHVTLPAGHWWRARKADGARVFTLAELEPPPPRAAAAEGRFNHYGQSVFYLGATQRAALRETIDIQGSDRVAWLQEFAIGEIDNIVDLRVKDWSEELTPPLIAVGLTSEYISATASTTAWKPEYLVPRFIADCARHAGYRGVAFKSGKHTHDNIVLFTWNDLAITPIGEPALRVVERDEEDEFWENPPF